MIKISLIFIQFVFFIAVAPFLSGLIAKLKNNFRMRKGQSVFQPYFNLIKLFSKGEVVSETASWIFRVTPFIVISSSLTVALLVPVFILSNPLYRMGDFLAIIFIFSLGRFFLALAALDTGSSFGGMGSSREMFISSLVEPGLCLAIFSIFMRFGSTNIFVFSPLHALSVASIVGAAALFLVAIAETSRIPVDNQETHLELTMVHEAMVLEYSGRSLALIEMALHLKQMVWFLLIAQVVFPIAAPSLIGLAGLFSWGLWYLARIFIIVIVVALVEVLVAKMRLFRVADFLGFVFVLGMLATICAILGV
jgi:formate hydrogenlyase subunit 4